MKVQLCNQSINYPIKLAAVTKKTRFLLVYSFLSYHFSDSPIEGYNVIEAQREMEQFCADRGGAVGLYAETHLTREEYDRMFHKIRFFYDRARKKYNCEKAFPHVYEKISRLGRAPM